MLSIEGYFLLTFEVPEALLWLQNKITEKNS